MHLETEVQTQAAEAAEAGELDAQAEAPEAGKKEAEVEKENRKCERFRAPTPVHAPPQWCNGKQRESDGGSATETEFSSSASSSAVSSPRGLRLRMPRSLRVDYSSNSSED